MVTLEDFEELDGPFDSPALNPGYAIETHLDRRGRPRQGTLVIDLHRHPTHEFRNSSFLLRPYFFKNRDFVLYVGWVQLVACLV